MASETILDCDCGARVRVPGERGQKSFRCPACKTVLAMAADAPVLTTITKSPGETGSICPICQSSIVDGESLVRCPECDQIHHHECWTEIGGCGTYGCTQAPVIDKPVAPVVTKSWGDKKTCPLCGESIKSIAMRCRHCNTDFDTTDPMTRGEFYRRRKLQRELQAFRAGTIFLFILSLLGLTAPLAGLIASGTLLPHREELRKCGPLYSFLAWATLILSGILTMLIAVFVIFEWT